MLKELHIRGGHGQDRDYTFTDLNRLLGRNGAGKSAILEAVSFLFAGTDARGTRAPVHLLRNGAERYEVTAVTAKATISRSLTAKKTSLLRLRRGEVVQDLTQAEMEGLVGASDVFLSIFHVGYFFGLPVDRRRRVLTECLPKQDPVAILASLCGFELSPAEADLVLTPRRPDLVAKDVASARLGKQSELDRNIGRLQELQRSPKMASEPVPTATDLSKWEALCGSWQSYETNQRVYVVRSREAATARHHNSELAHHRLQIEHELAGLQTLDSAKSEDRALEIRQVVKGLRAQQLPLPSPPATMSLPQGDGCPTCGQVVGSKHRQKVHEENQTRAAVFAAEHEKAQTHNRTLEVQIAGLEVNLEEFRREWERCRQHNAGIQQRRELLTKQLQTIHELPVPDVGSAPAPPQEVYDGSAHAAAKAQRADFERARNEWHFAQRLAAQAQLDAAQLAEQIPPLRGAIERLRVLEQGIKSLPEETLKRQAEALTMNQFVLDPVEMTMSHKDGRPFTALSSGEAMRAALAFSMKLDSLAPRPVRMHFLDNADLIDGDEFFGVDGRQIFAAYVAPEHASVEVVPFNRQA